MCELPIPSAFGKYCVVSSLGQGAFGKVLLVEHARTKTQYACKVIARNSDIDKVSLYYLEQELRVHQSFNHPNIAKMEEIVYTDDFIYVIMEYCENGDLFEYVLNLKYNVPFALAKKIIYQLASAINYMHERGIYHRDIKPENVLLDKELNVKLCDFGCCTHYKKCNSHDVCGTLVYHPPEIISRMAYDSEKADVWSFGITVYILLARAYPWDVTTDDNIRKSINNCKVDYSIISIQDFTQIIDMCLKIDYEKRPTIKRILDHRVFDSFHRRSLPQIKTCQSVFRRSRRMSLNKNNEECKLVSRTSAQLQSFFDENDTPLMM